MILHNILKMFGRDEALELDREDLLSYLRSEFVYPTKQDLKSATLADDLKSLKADSTPALYLCGNSLGLQPKRASIRVSEHMTAWAKKGVYGHFKNHSDSSLKGFLEMDAQAATMIAPIVGALPHEVAIAETLSANLHLLMSAFYKPTHERHKIVMESKAFPSDHYAVESQILSHGLDPRESMICIEPPNKGEAILSTSHIISLIDEHASSTALILLPGIQFYTGQYLDIKTITTHAHEHGITIGWDLAHAVGNVDLSLHDWDVDFAVWCNYKYLNAGPGAIAGMFVHAKHGLVDRSALETGKQAYRPRLAGWWGGDKSIRFEMGTQFVPIPGAQGFQVGNPSSLAISALVASLEVFRLVGMPALRKKSMALTGYLERLLLNSPLAHQFGPDRPYSIITPSSPNERGAQLSIRVQPGLLEKILSDLEKNGVVVDERKPDVIRVAPTPLYNTFEEVWDFVSIFTAACRQAGQETSLLHNGCGNADNQKQAPTIDAAQPQDDDSRVFGGGDEAVG